MICCKKCCSLINHCFPKTTGTVETIQIRPARGCFLKLFKKDNFRGPWEEIRVNSTEWTTLNHHTGVNILPQNHKLFPHDILLPDLTFPQQDSGIMTLEARHMKIFRGSNLNYFLNLCPKLLKNH